MKSKLAKELMKLRNSGLVCRHSKRKICNFASLTSSGGKFYEFFVTIALVIHPLPSKIGPVHLFGHVRLIGRIQYVWVMQFKMYLYIYVGH